MNPYEEKLLIFIKEQDIQAELSIPHLYFLAAELRPTIVLPSAISWMMSLHRPRWT